jgi:hypothetical protein
MGTQTVFVPREKKIKPIFFFEVITVCQKKNSSLVDIYEVKKKKSVVDSSAIMSSSRALAANTGGFSIRSFRG